MDFYLKKIDLYIFKKFIFSFFIALLLIIGIVIIFDISEKIDDFVANEAPLKAIIFNYYVNFIPFFINMYSPMFVFITVIFFTSKMAANSEIIAILSGGISYHRMMLPYMVATVMIALLSLGLNLYVIPEANATRLRFEARYVKNKATSVRDVHYQIDPGTFVYVESFSTWNNTAYKFTLESIEENKLVSKLTAETAAWDSLKQGWHLKKCFVRDFNEGLGDKVFTAAEMDTVINLTVSDFYRNKQTVQTLSQDQLDDLIKTQEMRGDANVMYAKIEKQTRFAMPFSAIILTIIGVSLSSRKRRGGIGWNIGLGIGLGFSYILFLKFSQMFVFTGTMTPMVALWLPNVLFTIVAAFIYRKASK
ncbi:MAG: LptF/LptG family permease [Bacteroidales bacterium]|nr:LptF/LptG family permease [Candidatus Cryptobacteroides onthequi]MCQ2163682.1 LptF/LptG family permease [Bacteroidales bacterium]